MAKIKKSCCIATENTGHRTHFESPESPRKLPYFLPAEVALHNKPEDFWVTCLGGVYDLTPYLAVDSSSPILKYVSAFGGKDISHWFEPRGRCGCGVRLKRYVVPGTGQRQILLPFTSPMPEGTKSSYVPISEGGCQGGRCRCAGPSCSSKSDDMNYLLEPKLTGKCWSELEYIFNGEDYKRGWLTKKARPCRITNVLTGLRGR